MFDTGVRKLGGIALLLVFASCSHKNPQTGGESSSLSPAPNPSTYTPRIGIAVSTGGRTCIAIHNANLAPGSPVTLVSPVLPQSFSRAEIGGASPSPCPVTKDVDPTVNNYDIQLGQSSVPKLIPLIAVVGESAPFSTVNNNVQADLDQNGKTETFRACSGNDGVYLTVWSGSPVTGAILWHGYYYEPNNAAIGPPCTPKETAPAGQPA